MGFTTNKDGEFGLKNRSQKSFKYLENIGEKRKMSSEVHDGVKRKGELMVSDPRVVIPELCREYYVQGAMTGIAGALSAKHDGYLYTTPSGVPKEKVTGRDLFVETYDGKTVVNQDNKGLNKSVCYPCFQKFYEQRNCGGVIHTHSMAAHLITRLCKGTEFKITHQNINKALPKCLSGGRYKNDECIVVPIVENPHTEQELADPISHALKDYPETCAVLVRNHGVFVCGETIERAKVLYECYDYLFKVAKEMIAFGIDPAETPHVPENAYTI